MFGVNDMRRTSGVTIGDKVDLSRFRQSSFNDQFAPGTNFSYLKTSSRVGQSILLFEQDLAVGSCFVLSSTDPKKISKFINSSKNVDLSSFRVWGQKRHRLYNISTAVVEGMNHSLSGFKHNLKCSSGDIINPSDQKFAFFRRAFKSSFVDFKNRRSLF